MRTVVKEYLVAKDIWKYESERELEEKFVEHLLKLGYKLLEISGSNPYKQLEDNLKVQLEKLNRFESKNFSFSNDDWDDLYYKLTHEGNGSEIKWERIQYEEKIGNYRIIDKEHLDRNCFQVLRQFRDSEIIGDKARFDVTLLINGFPIVQIELKSPKEVNLEGARKQIKRYHEFHFHKEKLLLFEFIHLFVISNGIQTRYFANFLTTEECPEIEDMNVWGDSKHEDIEFLQDFTEHFLNRYTLWNIITKYCVISTDSEHGRNKLIVMRPYQIDAVEAIIERIKQAIQLKKAGTKEAGGYIWHATGSGKTLTSFKAAQLALKIEGIDKVLFVVDRLALDKQTREEYIAFSKFKGGGIVRICDTSKGRYDVTTGMSFANTIVVTTIHKLSSIARDPELKSHKDKFRDTVLIFDECHRSLTGDQFNDIRDFCENHYIFGFTGTPIFPSTTNPKDTEEKFQCTQFLLGDQLACYSLYDALKDKKVLPFFVQGRKEEVKSGCSEEERKLWIVNDIIDNFGKWTKRSQENTNGYSALFAVDYVKDAIECYDLFQKVLKERNIDLKVATIFSPNNEENEFSSKFNFDSPISERKKKLLEVIRENLHSSDVNDKLDDQLYAKFRNRLAERLRNVEIDLVIVADIFLTGFNAPRLNTLILDKDKTITQEHKIVQACARTNRTWDSKKSCGHIIWYSGDSQRVEKAIMMYANSNDKQKIIWGLEDYRELEEKVEQKLKDIEDKREEINDLERERERLRSEGEDTEIIERKIFEEKKILNKQINDWSNNFVRYREFDEFQNEEKNKNLEAKLCELKELTREINEDFYDNDGTFEAQEGKKSISGGNKRKSKEVDPNFEPWDRWFDRDFVLKKGKSILKQDEYFTKLFEDWKKIRPESKNLVEDHWKKFLDENGLIEYCHKELLKLLKFNNENQDSEKLLSLLSSKIRQNVGFSSRELESLFFGPSFFDKSYSQQKSKFFENCGKILKNVQEFYHLDKKILWYLVTQTT